MAEDMISGLNESRLVQEEGTAAKIAGIAGPVAQSLGYRLVRVRLTGPTLQIMAERQDGSFTIEDCEALSRAVSPVLDADDPISGSYKLEVSSPGIDRPLVHKSDFARWTGFEVKMEFTQMMNGRKRARGLIQSADDEKIIVNIEGEQEPLHVPFTALHEAKLVMTDKLLSEAKKRATKGVADGSAFDAAEHDDIIIKEDRRTSHGH